MCECIRAHACVCDMSAWVRVRAMSPAREVESGVPVTMRVRVTVVVLDVKSRTHARQLMAVMR